MPKKTRHQSPLLKKFKSTHINHSFEWGLYNIPNYRAVYSNLHDRLKYHGLLDSMKFTIYKSRVIGKGNDYFLFVKKEPANYKTQHERSSTRKKLIQAHQIRKEELKKDKDHNTVRLPSWITDGTPRYPVSR
tara:strand:+ start:5889 stop:6284 length:396 start_codon:yes stop_codon:yes gene_type:complete